MNAIWRSAVGLVLLLLSACAGSQPQSWRSTDPYLEHANTKLEGRRAWLQLADGREVKDASRVSMGRVRVRWQVDDEPFEAPTESVLRVGIEPKERVARQVAVLVVEIALLVAAGGVLGAGEETPRSPESAEGRRLTPLERALAPLPGEVVYEARPRRSLPQPKAAPAIEGLGTT